MSKIWFITGISSGLGKYLAEEVMQQGHKVVGTFRKPEQAEEFTRQNPGSGTGIVLDVTNAAQIEAAVETVEHLYGSFDVLVNNAGFGFAGALEEASDAETRDVFDTNFFGAIDVTRAFLPFMRAQKSGHILQISSQAGFKAGPGFGVYNASKFALEGFSEAMAAEVAPLGIKVTIVQPGPFRTGFAGGGFKYAATEIEDYKKTAGVFRKRIPLIDSKQDGDPVKAAKAMIQITETENPPLRLPLGKVAIQAIESKLDSVRKEIEDWRKLAEDTAFPPQTTSN